MNGHDNDDLRLVAAFREDLDDQTPGRLASVRATFVKQQSLKGRTMTARKTIFTPRRIAVVALPAVAAIALGAVALGSIGGGTDSPGGSDSAAVDPGLAPDADARTVLAYAAANSTRFQTFDLTSGAYVYEHTSGTDYRSNATDEGPSVPGETAPYEREAWYTVEGMVLEKFVVTAFGETTSLPGDGNNDPLGKESEYAEEQLRADGPSMELPTPEYLAELPTGAAPMLETLRAELGQGDLPQLDDQRVFDQVAKILTVYGKVVPSAQRAAFLEAIAEIDGVTRTEGVADAAGRTGIAIGFDTGDDLRHEIIIDPETSEVLGTRKLLADGTVVSLLTTDLELVAAPGDTE